MKRHAAWIGCAMGWIALGAPAALGSLEYRVCVLSGRQEVPPNASPALGCGFFEIDTAANMIRYRIVYTGLTAAETAAHVHGFAPPGVNAGIKEPLALGGVKSGVWAYAEADEFAILDGRTYVNVHSAAFPGGEIRGQIVTHHANIDAMQEVPANASPAQGWGVFTINTVSNQLSYHIEFGGLVAAETQAHIHGSATHGTNAGVLQPLALGSPKTGVWNYPEALEKSIIDGLMYVNIHSAAFPGGEIRGQICATVAPIDARQEVPPNGSPAAGCGLIAIDRGADRLSYDISYANLTAAETMAHIHGFAPPGVNAGVLTPLPLGTRKLGVWGYPAGNEIDIVSGRTYINIHSAANPGGEIRGQVQFPPYPCPGDLNCDGVVDLSDLSGFLAAFGATSPMPGYIRAADLDLNGVIDLSDLSGFLALFGTSC